MYGSAQQVCTAGSSNVRRASSSRGTGVPRLRWLSWRRGRWTAVLGDALARAQYTGTTPTGDRQMYTKRINNTPELVASVPVGVWASIGCSRKRITANG